MLEFVSFNFAFVELPIETNSLDNLLKELDVIDMRANDVSFSHLVPFIATDIVDGLSYLHSIGIAHRDMKPGNILISNKHTLSRSFTKPSDWSNLQLTKWDPYSLPFYGNMKGKLSNLQIISLISSSFQRTNRIPQNCRRNSIFAINTGVLKKLNDCLSDLNGKFPFKIEGRIHTVEIKKAVNGW